LGSGKPFHSRILSPWAIPCAGEKVYSPRHRSVWLEKLSEVGLATERLDGWQSKVSS
jgi:hypothetical protein